MGATSPAKHNDIKLITEDLSILSFNDAVAERAAQIYHELRLGNKIIEFRDIFIAATCIIHDLPLLTLNKKHFDRIRALELVK